MLPHDQTMMPYTHNRKSSQAETRSPKSDNLGKEWSEEIDGYFGSEHTLVLIICLSAIATMLILILFIMAMWLKRRSQSTHQSRVCQLEDHQRTQGGGFILGGGGSETMKRVLVNGSGKMSPYSDNTLLHNIVSWGGEDGGKMMPSVDDIESKKRGSSPVYWLRTVGGKPMDPKNVC